MKFFVKLMLPAIVPTIFTSWKVNISLAIRVVTIAELVGAVTGIVGAAGGLGGFVPPLVMGAVFGAVGGYSIGLGMLALVFVGAAMFARGPPRRSAWAT